MNFSLSSQATMAPAPPGSSQGLPELERAHKRKSRIGAKLAILAVALALVAGGVAFTGLPIGTRSLKGLFASSRTNVLTFAVRKGKLPVTVKERGNLESSENQDIFCLVEGQTTIIKIEPEGTRVKKGDVVAELDSSTLKDNLTNQEITTKGAEAAYQNARLTREVAEIAVREYREGIYKQDKQSVESEIMLARSDLTRAEDRVKWATRMEGKGYISKAQKISEDLALQKAKVSLEQAQTKQLVLDQFTREKTIKELQSEVEKANADELAKKATWELEKSKEEKLRKQIENCILRAPGDGLVVYANDPSRFGGSSAPQIEEGAMVRERQKIFSLPDITHMRVNTKVHESMVDRVQRGLPARIRVDAFPNEMLTGKVESVNPLPDQSSFFSSDIKVYTTLVTIDDALAGLRPGMTAAVEILVTELENVVYVPVQAVLQVKGKDYVYVKGAEGFVRKPVTLGINNDQLIEVKQGIQTGEEVALDPVGLLTEEEKQEFFGAGAAASDAKTKEWGADATKKAADANKGSPEVLKGKGGAGKGKAGAGKGKGGAGKGGGGGGAFMKNMTDEEKASFRSGSPEEKRKLLEDKGVPAEMIDRMMQGGFGGGGGGRGGGGGGPRGGGGEGGPGQ